MTSSSSTPVVLSDSQAYQSGAYTAYIAAFNTGGLVNGVGYTEQITLDPSQFPNALNASWSFPTTSVASIKTFIAVDYGDYYNTTPLASVAPAQIANIGTLTETTNFTLAGNLQGFDVITDMFLTSAAGDNSTNAAEVEVFLHTPSYSASWISSLTQLGTVTISGIQWTVAESIDSGQPDLLFMPTSQQDVAANTIDINAMLQYLVNKGAISGSLYFNGLATGVETDSGSGSLTLNNMSVSYSPVTNASASASNTPTIALADQTGVTLNSLSYTTDAALDGTSAPNATLMLYDSSGIVAVINSDASGDWSYNPTSALPNGYNDLIITETDANGAASSASIAIMLNTTAETISESIVRGSGRLSHGSYLTAPTVAGMTSANTEVMLYDNNNYIGQVMSNSAGAWSYHLTNPSVGHNTVVASAENLYGSSATAATQFNFV